MASKSAGSNLETDIDALLQQKHPYFVGKPEAFQQSADVLLVLDSKEELPVHSTFLCAHSSVFCEISTSTSPEDGALVPRRLPLPDCTEAAVNALLLCLYAQDAIHHLSLRSAQHVTKLAHKFGLQSTLRICDEFLAINAGTGGNLDALRVRLLSAKPLMACLASVYFSAWPYLHAMHPSCVALFSDSWCEMHLDAYRSIRVYAHDVHSQPSYLYRIPSHLSMWHCCRVTIWNRNGSGLSGLRKMTCLNLLHAQRDMLWITAAIYRHAHQPSSFPVSAYCGCWMRGISRRAMWSLFVVRMTNPLGSLSMFGTEHHVACRPCSSASVPVSSVKCGL